ncbi:MAG TPA: response regulator [Methylomirabilota bacterium]|nr:response regulator [Methylomirabilota bacterium]
MAKVLVVDDSVSVRKVVAKALEGRSMEVLSAASGREAIESIERDRPDLVVCDVILPDKDGYQVCEFVRAHPAVGRTPVLLISGVVNSTVLARAAEVQSTDVMFKPFAAEELVRKIDTLLGSRTGAANGRAAVTRMPVASHAAAPLAGAPPASAPPVTPPRGTVAPGGVGPGAGLKGRLNALAAAAGVHFVALADREGFLIESAGDLPPQVEVAGAMAACLTESSDGVGRELGQGALIGMILEYESGVVLLNGVGANALLAVCVGDVSALGKVRYFVKKALPDLERAL